MCYWLLPLSQQEVVGLDVGVDDVDAVQLLHHVQDADGEVHDERLRHHFVAQGFEDVHRVLRAESQLQDGTNMRQCLRSRHRVAEANLPAACRSCGARRAARFRCGRGERSECCCTGDARRAAAERPAEC